MLQTSASPAPPLCFRNTSCAKLSETLTRELRPIFYKEFFREARAMLPQHLFDLFDHQPYSLTFVDPRVLPLLHFESSPCVRDFSRSRYCKMRHITPFHIFG
jgi:hypothetical protein